MLTCWIAPSSFPEEIQTFAVLYANMRKIREDADYDPDRTRSISPQHVMAKISDVDYAIEQFSLVAEPHRRAFTILVAVKKRSY